MQMAQQQHGELERVYTMIGAVVMAWSPEMETAMLSAIETLEIYPDQEVVERHRDGGDWVL